MNTKYYLFFIYLVLLTSCTSYKSLVNFNQSYAPAQPATITNYTPIKLEPNDILQIDVKSLESESVSILASKENENYLIGEDGTIDFPLVGEVSLKGMSIAEAKITLVEELNKYYVKPPIVNIRLLNFRINVNGEVGGPGSFIIEDERVSLIDAITLAGDFTVYSRRDSILIIREQDDIRSFAYVDFNSFEVLNSPYFYLKQNDVVYVQPTKSKLGTVRDNQTKILPYISVGVSLLLLLRLL